ncbi:MAG: AI-2E family transporter [bacterium]|nr:AI-2E family transporter [bacterium]
MKNDELGEVELEISSGTIIRTIIIIALFALAWFLRDIILVVLSAIVLASALEPLVRFIVSKGPPRLLALVMVYLFGGAFLAGVIYFFVPAILDDVSRLARVAPQYLDIGSLWDPLQEGSVVSQATGGKAALPNVSGIEQGLREGANVLDLFKSGIEEGGAVHGASVLFGGFLSFVLIVVLSFYLSAQERGIENFFRLISPAKSRGYIVDLWKRSQAKIGLWFQGQLLLGLLVGILAFLGLSILGVSSALFLAFLMMIFEIIPVFGPILAAVPGVAIAFTEGMRGVDPGITAALFIALFYFIIQQFESHLFYPLVVRKVIGIPPVLVILALVIGAKVAGFLGILLAVPITAVLMEFLNDVARERRIYEDN